MIELDVAHRGQVFTPEWLVEVMLSLRKRRGRTLEPSAGEGAFSSKIPGCVAIELDARLAPEGAIVQDFFAYASTERFASIIGNPPYVPHKSIEPATKQLLAQHGFDRRTNLFIHFIFKSASEHLDPDGGELIFIVPRSLLKLTAARKLNQWLFDHGTITHWMETGDQKIFHDVVPNCAIFRFEMGDFTRRTFVQTLGDPAWHERTFSIMDGQIAFLNGPMSIRFADLFDVKVGAVSGLDSAFVHQDGNVDFVCSTTRDTGQTRRMLYNTPHQDLEPHKAELLARKIKRFDDKTWWMWGRAYHESPLPRIYVNGKTRRRDPFFVHDCKAYDGSVLAILPKAATLNVERAAWLLNRAVPWDQLGFVVGGRYVFSQRTLTTLSLPAEFGELLTA